jgi:hypothetical protein
MNLVPVETPCARVAAARKAVKLLNAALGIVVDESLQIIVD